MNERAEAAATAEPDGAMSMNDAERMRILELLQEGKINAAEAAELLSALDAATREPPPRESSRQQRARWHDDQVPPGRARVFRVRVTDTKTGRTRANVAMPIGMVGFGLGLGKRFRIHGGHQLDDIMAAVREGRHGTVFDVHSGDGGERIEIIIE